MIAAFDLDGTLLKKNSSFAFCCYLQEKRVFSRKDLMLCSLTYLKHLYLDLPLGELHDTLFKRLFEGRHVEELRPHFNVFLIERIQKLWYQPALLRLRALQKSGASLVILSNSPRFIVEPIAHSLGVEHVIATDYHTDDKGRLTGVGEFVDGPRKAVFLNQAEGQKTIAFSDSHLDLSFLEAALTAVAVNPKSRLKKIALAKGWEIL